MKKITVYFFQKEGHRERQKDTVRFAPEQIQSIGKKIKEENNLEVYKYHTNKRRQLIVKTLTKIPLLNLRKIPSEHKEAKFTYLWGCLPINIKNKFIVELDNPYSLTFYKKKSFRIYKPIIKKILNSKKCHKIVCISEACKNKTVQLLGNKIENKITVQYPFIKELPKNKSQGKKIKYLFIGFDFEGKGGIELIKAFEKSKIKDYELKIIGPEKRKEKNTNIQWLGKINRKEILEKYMPESDILCFPTYYESLGMVALESVSAGLGIISTNTFAIPEIVTNNGILINNPFLTKKVINGILIADPTEQTLGEFKKTHQNEMPSKRLTKELITAIQKSEKEYLSWKKNSTKIYKEKFSEEIWKKNFLKIFE